MAVADAICRTAKRRNEFSSAVIAIEAEDKIPKSVSQSVGPGVLAPLEQLSFGQFELAWARTCPMLGSA